MSAYYKFKSLPPAHHLAFVAAGLSLYSQHQTSY